MHPTEVPGAARNVGWKRLVLRTALFFVFIVFFPLGLAHDKGLSRAAGDYFLACGCVIPAHSSSAGKHLVYSPPVSLLNPPLKLTLVSWITAPFTRLSPRVGQGVSWMLRVKWYRTRRRRSPWDFPRVCLPTPTSARGVQSRLTQSLSHCFFTGDLWVTVPARDFATPFCRNLERKNQPLPVPSPSATISDTPNSLLLGYPVTSRQHARSTGRGSGDHLSQTC